MLQGGYKTAHPTLVNAKMEDLKNVLFATTVPGTYDE
jgi:hypothetical protein